MKKKLLPNFLYLDFFQKLKKSENNYKIL